MDETKGTVLVTGANGFIGSHLAEGLLARGYTVRCMVRPSSNLRHVEDLPVDAGVREEFAHDPGVVFEPVGRDQGRIREVACLDGIAKERPGVRVAPAPDDCADPPSRPDSDGSEDPGGIVFAAAEGADLVRLDFLQFVALHHQLVEGLGSGGSLLLRSRRRVSRDAHDPGSG